MDRHISETLMALCACYPAAPQTASWTGLTLLVACRAPANFSQVQLCKHGAGAPQRRGDGGCQMTSSRLTEDDSPGSAGAWRAAAVCGAAHGDSDVTDQSHSPTACLSEHVTQLGLASSATASATSCRCRSIRPTPQGLGHRYRPAASQASAARR